MSSRAWFPLSIPHVGRDAAPMSWPMQGHIEVRFVRSKPALVISGVERKLAREIGPTILEGLREAGLSLRHRIEVDVIQHDYPHITVPDGIALPIAYAVAQADQRIVPARPGSDFGEAVDLRGRFAKNTTFPRGMLPLCWGKIHARFGFGPAPGGYQVETAASVEGRLVMIPTAANYLTYEDVIHSLGAREPAERPMHPANPIDIPPEVILIEGSETAPAARKAFRRAFRPAEINWGPRAQHAARWIYDMRGFAHAPDAPPVRRPHHSIGHKALASEIELAQGGGLVLSEADQITALTEVPPSVFDGLHVLVIQTDGPAPTKLRRWAEKVGARRGGTRGFVSVPG